MLERALRTIGVLLGVVGLAGILWTSSIWYQYQRTLPRHPDVLTGRVYPLNVHGIVVYQTSKERNWRDTIQYFSITLFAASGLAAGVHRWKFQRSAQKVRC
jgi:hypothetical protein